MKLGNKIDDLPKIESEMLVEFWSKSCGADQQKETIIYRSLYNCNIGNISSRQARRNTFKLGGLKQSHMKSPM